MRTITTLAVSRIKYNKSRTILTAVAIMLTTILLAGIVTSVVGLQDVNRQQAVGNGNVHATFLDLNKEQVEILRNHMDVEAMDISEMFATVEYEKMNGTLNYGEQLKEGIYYRVGDIIEGHEAVNADEICGPPAFFERMGVEPVIGNKITISFRPHGKGSIETREFTICGLVSQIDVSDIGISDARIAYSATVSEALVEEYFTPDEREYNANIRALGEEYLSYDEMKEKIDAVAENIGADKDKVSFNNQYLFAMTGPDTEMIQIAGMIAFLIILFAGLVIYSIYYVSVITDVQEIGKLKAIGASDKQIKKLLLKEGMRIALFAEPAGLILGYLLPRIFLPLVANYAVDKTMMAPQIEAYHMFSLPLLLCVAVTVLVIIYISLLKPMRMAAKISPVEAIRYQESSNSQKIRKGNESVNIIRLSAANLTRNKKRTIVTMMTMGLSCVLFMCLAGVLNSMRAEDTARWSIPAGDFRLGLDYSRNDRAYPEKNLDSLQKQNIFNDAFLESIRQIDGVEKIEREKSVLISSEFPSDIFKEGERVAMLRIDREWCREHQDLQERGEVDYDKMLEECGAIFTADYWMDELGFALGDMVPLIIHDGDRQIPFTVKIMATMTTGKGYFALPEELFDGMGIHCDATTDIYISVDEKKYDNVKAAMQKIADSEDYFILYSMDEELKISELGIMLMKYSMYVILGIIMIISFMNLINTMITSIITRKRELGILQAIGLSDRQLTKMLAGEGMVFIIGTLLIALSFGNLLGYIAFQWAKENHFMNLQAYHYPVWETVLLFLVLVFGQFGVTVFISKRIRRESLIDRIRSGE